MGKVTAAIFRDGRIVEHVALDASIPRREPSEFIWIEALDPVDRDFEILRQRFGLHRVAIEDSMRPAHVPKVDTYGDQVFVLLKVARLENDAIRYGEIDAFLSARHIITVRRSADDGQGPGHDAFHHEAAPSRLSPDFILHAILDFVVNGYFPIVQMIEDEALSMEQHLQDATLDREEITRLFRLRRESLRFQHMLTRMSEVCGKLTNLDVPGIGPEAKPYFRHVHARLAHLDSMLRGLLDVIATVFATSSLLEQQRQGIITRQLAAWAGIFGVPAALAEIYGNVSPVLRAPIEPAIVLGTLVAIGIGLYARFRQLRWL